MGSSENGEQRDVGPTSHVERELGHNVHVELAQGAKSGEPQVRLHRLSEIDTFEVMATDLDRLEEAVGEKEKAMGFCLAAAGTCVGAITGWPTADASALRFGLQGSIIGVTLFITLWSALAWRHKASQHKSLSAQIRQRVIGATSPR